MLRITQGGLGCQEKGEKMQGYKVYFDGKEWRIEDKKSEVEDSGSDDFNRWFDTFQHGMDAVESLNQRTKTDISKVQKLDDLLLCKCKECGNDFLQSGDEIEWFKEKRLQIPKRCRKCRYKNGI